MFEKTTSKKRIKYKSNPKKDQFMKVLRTRVWAYFKENNISKNANGEMYFKTVLAIVSWLGLYGLIMSDYFSFSYLATIGAFCVLGFINIFMAFNIVHDACHDAYFKSKKANKYMGLFMNFIGGNAYLFTRMHNAHHQFVNIHGSDVTLETHGLFRFTPDEPWQPKHKWQHIYTPIVYCLASLHWTAVKDFKWFFMEEHIGNKKDIKHPRSEFWTLIITKIVYFSLHLFLPMALLGVPWWVVFIGYLMLHIPSSLMFALVFQVTHIYEGTTFPLPDDEGNIENNYAVHVLETTADFSRSNPIANWFFGCINVHSIHHIMPGICHVHYPELTKILKATAEEFGLEYKESETFLIALRRHLHMLKALSKPEAEIPRVGNSVNLV